MSNSNLNAMSSALVTGASGAVRGGGRGKKKIGVVLIIFLIICCAIVVVSCVFSFVFVRTNKKPKRLYRVLFGRDEEPDEPDESEE